MSNGVEKIRPLYGTRSFARITAVMEISWEAHCGNCLSHSPRGQSTNGVKRIGILRTQRKIMPSMQLVYSSFQEVSSLRSHICVSINSLSSYRPHGSCINYLQDLHFVFTQPDHRRLGVGSIAVEWGIAKAKELKVGIHLDCTTFSTLFFEKHKFELMYKNDITPVNKWPHTYWCKLTKNVPTLVELIE